MDGLNRPVRNKRLPVDMAMKAPSRMGRDLLNDAPDIRRLKLVAPKLSQTAPNVPSLYLKASKMYVTIAPTCMVRQMASGIITVYESYRFTLKMSHHSSVTLAIEAI